MGATFTKGPWSIAPQRTSLSVRGSHGRTIATIRYDYDPANNRDTKSANARLIAAAPDLYAAVKSLLAAADHAGGLGGCDPELEAACKIGSAAIAKATARPNPIGQEER